MQKHSFSVQCGYVLRNPLNLNVLQEKLLFLSKSPFCTLLPFCAGQFLTFQPVIRSKKVAKVAKVALVFFCCKGCEGCESCAEVSPSHMLLYIYYIFYYPFNIKNIIELYFLYSSPSFLIEPFCLSVLPPLSLQPSSKTHAQHSQHSQHFLHAQLSQLSQPFSNTTAPNQCTGLTMHPPQFGILPKAPSRNATPLAGE